MGHKLGAFTLDDHGLWEKSWESNNPEPHPIIDNITWSQLLERVEWHKRRWEAFKIAFAKKLKNQKVEE